MSNEKRYVVVFDAHIWASSDEEMLEKVELEKKRIEQSSRCLSNVEVTELWENPFGTIEYREIK